MRFSMAIFAITAAAAANQWAFLGNARIIERKFLIFQNEQIEPFLMIILSVHTYVLYILNSIFMWFSLCISVSVKLVGQHAQLFNFFNLNMF